MGDHLVAARFIRDLRAQVGDFTFDIYSARPWISEWLFARFDGFVEAHEQTFSWHLGAGRYEVRLSLTDFVTIDEIAVTPGKTSAAIKNVLRMSR